MYQTIEYKGKTIQAYTYKAGNGFRWTYQIDGGISRDCKDRPIQSEELMLNEAISQAKTAIDRISRNEGINSVTNVPPPN